MNDVRLAAIQMNSGDDVAANLKVAGSLLERAAADGAQLAVLPENFAALGADENLRISIAEADGTGPVQDALAELAARLKLWIVAGTISIRGENALKPFASCCVYDASGVCIARYDKIHLFDVDLPNRDENYRESANTAAGESPVLVDTPWGRLGLAVCYDLRFPELFRHLCSEGMEMLALPAAFTYSTGEAHWRTLVKARAIENLCYVAAAAQTGHHPGGRQTYGHSMIVDPWGEVMADAGDNSGWIAANADAARLHGIRRQFPVLSHRRISTGSPDDKDKR
jgi:predicted amidohydrolase